MIAGRPLRVLQVGPLYVNHVQRWAEHASAVGCTVHVAGHVRRGRQLVDFCDVAERVEVLPDELVGAGTVRRAAWLRRLVAELRPDIVHAHWLSTWGCLATFGGQAPVIVTPWGSDVYLATGAARALGDLGLRRATRVVARSRHMHAELVARGAPPSRIVPLDLGVDLERFRPAAPRERQQIRDRLNLGTGPVILSLRAGTALYNLDVALGAFQRVRERFPTVTLVMVNGDAPLSWSMRRALREHAHDVRVQVLGAIGHVEMALYMRAATVGISIPQSDGSPNAVWEALSCGLPLVLSELPQIAERVSGTSAARLVEPTVDEVATAICDVVVHRRRMAQAARSWAVANLDQRDQRAPLEALYRSITAGRLSNAGWRSSRRR